LVRRRYAFREWDRRRHAFREWDERWSAFRESIILALAAKLRPTRPAIHEWGRRRHMRGKLRAELRVGLRAKLQVLQERDGVWGSAAAAGNGGVAELLEDQFEVVALEEALVSPLGGVEAVPVHP